MYIDLYILMKWRTVKVMGQGKPGDGNTVVKNTACPLETS